MQDIVCKLECGDETFDFIFNINTITDLQEKFGSLEAWQDLCSPSDKATEPNFKAVLYFFMYAFNEAIDKRNDENGTDDKLFNLRQTGRIISKVGIEKASKALQHAVEESTKMPEKNELSTTKSKKPKKAQ